METGQGIHGRPMDAVFLIQGGRPLFLQVQFYVRPRFQNGVETLVKKCFRRHLLVRGAFNEMKEVSTFRFILFEPP